MKNIFNINDLSFGNEEIFENLFDDKEIRIERIISTGQKTPEGNWLCEEENEWVLLLQGNSIISFESDEKFEMKQGDYLFIPSGKRHRVEFTSVNPHCIWLAIHSKI
jgi:cupin 2 domain-containing protein